MPVNVPLHGEGVHPDSRKTGVAPNSSQLGCTSGLRLNTRQPQGVVQHDLKQGDKK